MQTQPAEAVCLQVKLGQIGLVSMPADYVPRRVDWAKWVDCVAIGSKAMNQRIGMAPRVCVSPDHKDAKDNLALVSLQEQSGLEYVDLLKMFSGIVDGTRFLFAGSWSQPIPSWINSSQAVFSARYGSMIPDILSSQLGSWAVCAERMETRGSFLVTDDVGRLSSLSLIAKNWRARQIRSGMLAETRSPSWFAAMIDVHMPKSTDGSPARIHRLAALEPENWCGAPKINEELLESIRHPADCPEIWISSPSMGLSLWIAEQQGPLSANAERLRIPSAVVGWHPLRDAVAFLAEAPPKSYLYMVDRHSRLQVLMKEQDTSP
jgi:hypothetical protein